MDIIVHLAGESKKALCDTTKTKISNSIRLMNMKTANGCITKDKNKYRVKIPESWIPVDETRQTRFCFNTRQDACDFIKYFYDKCVNGRDKPIAYDNTYNGPMCKRLSMGCIYNFKGKIRARVKRTYLGTFDSMKEAKVAVDNFIKK